MPCEPNIGSEYDWICFKWSRLRRRDEFGNCRLSQRRLVLWNHPTSGKVIEDHRRKLSRQNLSMNKRRHYGKKDRLRGINWQAKEDLLDLLQKSTNQPTAVGSASLKRWGGVELSKTFSTDGEQVQPSDITQFVGWGKLIPLLGEGSSESQHAGAEFV